MLIYLAFVYLCMVSKTDIIARLQREIMPLQGYKPRMQPAMNQELEWIARSFPGQQIPLGAIHEYHCADRTDVASTTGFIAGLIHSCRLHEGIIVWVGRSTSVFPSTLTYFGLRPEQCIFITLDKEKDRLWVIEEALKCSAIRAVVGENRQFSFQVSRRYQLAVEHSGVTGFLIRDDKVTASACIARWKVRSQPSLVLDGLPGIGFPRWQVELCKVRNGQPGTWQLSWVRGRFHAELMGSLEDQRVSKTG